MRGSRRAVAAILAAAIVLAIGSSIVAPSGPAKPDRSLTAADAAAITLSADPAATPQRATHLIRRDPGEVASPAAGAQPARDANGTSQAARDSLPGEVRFADRAPRDRSEPALTWPTLDPPVVEPDRLTARITGHDPLGDRPLWLWRRTADGAEIVKRAHSDRTGRFDFGDVPIPNGDHRLVVTSETGDPLTPSPTDATRPQLPAPRFAWTLEEDAIRIQLFPALYAGELLVMDDRENVWRRIEPGVDPLRVDIAGGRLVRNHSVVHVLPDGRRSPRTWIFLAASAP